MGGQGEGAWESLSGEGCLLVTQILGLETSERADVRAGEYLCGLDVLGYWMLWE